MTFLKSAVVFLFVLALGVSQGCDSSSLPAELERDTGTVTLEIDFGGEKESKSIVVVCSPDSTVLKSLERAQNIGKLKLEFSGSGETAFVNSIDGIKNEGSGGKSWTYRVNDTLGDKSAGIYNVKPADRISWTFGSPPKELE